MQGEYKFIKKSGINLNIVRVAQCILCDTIYINKYILHIKYG